jgi:hypothetical protein
MTTSQNPARQIIFRSNNHQIVSVYDRRYLVQRYNRYNGQWFTEKICDNDAEAREYLSKHGVI